MSRILERRLSRLVNGSQTHLLRGSRIGLEKEGLRVGPEGSIAPTDHPRALGSALTHPWITTDYSEALLEFITPPYRDLTETLRFLEDIHRFVYGELGEEFIWGASMPCVVDGENSIRIAEYGTSNAGRMKHLYRVGLAHRYGKLMQVIAGVHFNFSLPEEFWPHYRELEGDQRPLQDFVSACYFGLIRNLQRYGWLIPYLFGASPAICKSFLAGQPQRLTEFDANTYFEPYATSLRMSDIGYTNRSEKKAGLKVSYDSLAAYIDSISYAIATPCPRYRAIGVKVDGQYRQLNANILQIENEYYSTMRPKQVLEGDEKPVVALARRGVRYVELRSLDLNPFDPLGVNEQQLHFLEAFLLFCLIQDSPPIGAAEQAAIDDNQLNTAFNGRHPTLKLIRDAQEVPLMDWGLEICQRMAPFCELLDNGDPRQVHGRSLAAARAALEDPDLTPSARMLAEMRSRGEGFFHFAKRHSLEHRRRFLSGPRDQARMNNFHQEAQASLERQARLEAGDTLSFEDYLRRYFAQG